MVKDLTQKATKVTAKRESVLYLSPVSSSLCVNAVKVFRNSSVAAHVAAVRWFLLEVDERHGVLSPLQ